MSTTQTNANVGIVDYGAGNLRSVVNAFTAIGANAGLINSPEQLEGLTHLVLPGQGEFGDCATKLRQSGLFDCLLSWIQEDRPFLGICVGYQLLFEGSDESPEIPGLGVFQGRVRHFGDHGLKVPHMGWNSIQPTQPDANIWQGLEPSPYFYYVHSFFPKVADPSILAASSHYGETFHCAVTRGNLLATQFHPEKSQDAGLQLLKNFLSIR